MLALFQMILFLIFSGIHELLHESLMRCEEKYRSRLLSNIVLTGGNSLFPGFDKRLETELISLLPDNVGKHVKVNAQPGRDNFTWKGGVHLCSLDSFQGKVMYIRLANMPSLGSTQPLNFAYKWLLNKSYENKVTLTRQ